MLRPVSCQPWSPARPGEKAAPYAVIPVSIVIPVPTVIPAKAGIQHPGRLCSWLDPRFRGDDSGNETSQRFLAQKLHLHLHAEMARHREDILVTTPAQIHHQQIV